MTSAEILAEANAKKRDGEEVNVNGIYVNSQPLRVKKKAVLERQMEEAYGP